MARLQVRLARLGYSKLLPTRGPLFGRHLPHSVPNQHAGFGTLRFVGGVPDCFLISCGGLDLGPEFRFQGFKATTSHVAILQRRRHER